MADKKVEAFTDEEAQAAGFFGTSADPVDHSLQAQAAIEHDVAPGEVDGAVRDPEADRSKDLIKMPKPLNPTATPPKTAAKKATAKKATARKAKAKK